MALVLVMAQPPASRERRSPAGPGIQPRAPQSAPARVPAAGEVRDSTPPAVVSWERITWSIEQGLQPVEIDRLRRFSCIPGRLMPATYARLFRALGLWKLNDDERDRRIDRWRCGTGQAAPTPARTQTQSKAKGAPARSAKRPPGRSSTKAPAKTSPSRPGGASSSAPPRSATSDAGRIAPTTAANARGRTPSAGTDARSSAVAMASGGAPAAPTRPQAGTAASDTTVQLTVVSAGGRLPVALNRTPLGMSPISRRVPRGRLLTIAVGEGDQYQDTTLYVTGRHDLVVTVERGYPVGEQRAGAPLPTASALTRSTVESEIIMTLPVLPPQPVVPSMRTPRGARTDLYWSLAVSGVAALSSSRHCRTQATAPDPYGGTFTGTYHAAGTFVPSAFLLCTSAIGLTSGAVSYPIFRIFSRFANEGERRRYVADSASLPQRQAAYVQMARTRQSMVDSAFERRQQEHGMPLLRWRVDTLPRRLP